MVSYLQVENLTKSYGDNFLFTDINFGIAQGDKVGLIARNGKGKSTLLRILAGKEDYDSGSIVFRNGVRVGFLDQNPEFDYAKSILENISGDDKEHEESAKRFMTQLGLNAGMKPEKMSGGEMKRAAIARLLVSDPDMLILDEPTNHLDIGVIEWLENYLATKKTTLLMVTHDRYFLDNVCSRIFEIDMEKLYSYQGNYDYYIEKRAERRENMSVEKEKVQNLLRKEREWMRRQPQARGSKAKYRIDNFHELEKRSKINLSEGNISTNGKGSYIGSKIFEAHNICKSFGDKCLMKDWSYVFARYEKVGIVGDNGVGKSTFIKMLLGEVSPDSGKFDIGSTVKFGYYSQEGMVGFNPDMKVIDAVREISETVRIDDTKTITASSFLTRFLFPYAEQQKYIRTLSGGERRRLYLATVLMRNPNFLILDEPTNDLDIPTLAILEEYLSEFKGCVIVISHDRYFLDRIADHLFVFKGNGVIKDFPGDYSTYRHCLKEEQRHKQNEAKNTLQKNKPPKERTTKAGLTYKEKQEKRQIEERISLLETEKSKLETEMSSGTMDTESLLHAGKHIRQIMDELDNAEMRLLELMDKEC